MSVLRRSAPERRRHVVYLTRNTEYHCRDAECVGVRDRSTGRWQRGHPALRSQLLGGVAAGSQSLADPAEGSRLLFSGSHTVVTSPVVLAGRPDREAVFSYISLCRAGEILTAA